VRVAEVRVGLRGEVVGLVAAQLLERFADRDTGLQLTIEVDSELHGLGIVDFPVWGDDTTPPVAQTGGAETSGLAKTLGVAADAAGVEIEDGVRHLAESAAAEGHGLDNFGVGYPERCQVAAVVPLAVPVEVHDLDIATIEQVFKAFEIGGRRTVDRGDELEQFITFFLGPVERLSSVIGSEQDHLADMERLWLGTSAERGHPSGEDMSDPKRFVFFEVSVGSGTNEFPTPENDSNEILTQVIG
jgi:hypothetical protein